MRLIALVIIIPAAIGGALWWYFEVYRSAQYARAVVPLWEETEALSTRPELSDASPKNERDYQGAVEVLRRRKAATQDIRERILRLQPSRDLVQIHKDFVALLDGYVAAISDAEKKAKFFANAKNLQELLKEQPSGVLSSSGTSSSGEGANTISDIARLLEDQIPQAKNIGGELFKSGLSRLIPGVSLDKLFSSWQGASPVLDTVLQLVRGFDQNLPASQFSKLLQSSNKQTELHRINRYLEEAASASRTIAARDLLEYRSFEGEDGVTKEWLELRARRLRDAMEELQKSYSL